MQGRVGREDGMAGSDGGKVEGGREGAGELASERELNGRESNISDDGATIRRGPGERARNGEQHHKNTGHAEIESTSIQVIE